MFYKYLCFIQHFETVENTGKTMRLVVLVLFLLINKKANFSGNETERCVWKGYRTCFSKSWNVNSIFYNKKILKWQI